MATINFAGIASGIDSEALIDALSESQRNIKVKPKEDKISELGDTNSALTELKTKMTELQTLLRKYTTVGGGIVAKQAISSDESVLTAVASNSARNGAYSLTVTNLAKNATATLSSTAQTYANGSSVINSGINNGAAAASRTVSITVGTGAELETVDVLMTNTTTLDQFVTSFNNTSNRASASLINVGTSAAPDYQIMITSDNQGTSKGEVAMSVGSEITSAGLGAFNDNTLSQATNAEFTMDGVSGTITRSSNTVNDLIAGVTFSLTNTGTATVAISTDNASTISSAKEFVEKFNELVKYIDENNQVTREEDGEDVSNVFGALAKTRVDDNVLTSLRSVISSSSITDGSAEAITIFGAMGIKTQRDGTLEFDEDEFEDALNAEPESVKTLFQTFSDTAAMTGGTIDQYIRFNGLLDVTVNGNKTQISSMNEQITRAESIIAKMAESQRARFARLEGLMGTLQNQQNSLASILGSG